MRPVDMNISVLMPQDYIVLIFWVSSMNLFPLKVMTFQNSISALLLLHNQYAYRYAYKIVLEEAAGSYCLFLRENLDEIFESF